MSKTRKFKNFTTQEIADKCGVSQCAVVKWFNVEMLPKVKHAKVMQDEFKIPLEIWTDKKTAEKAIKKMINPKFKRISSAKQNTKC